MALFIVAMPAQVFANMTADELRTEITRLSKVADSIRAQLVRLGDNPSTVLPGTSDPNQVIVQPVHTPLFCMKSNLQMRRGHSGSSVTRLQQFLVQSGVYPQNLVTGHFGPATEAGVQRWQSANGIVSRGTPTTTGFGRVGPSTLRAMHRGCIGGRHIGHSGTLTDTRTPSTSRPSTSRPSITNNVQVERYSLSLNPVRGSVPFRVTADFTIAGSTCTSYSLDWGDGSMPISYNSNKSSGCKSKNIQVSKYHIYRKAGTHSVIFKTGKAPIHRIKKVNELRVEAIR